MLFLRFFVVLTLIFIGGSPVYSVEQGYGVKVEPGCKGVEGLVEREKTLGMKFGYVLDFVGYESASDIKSVGWWVNCWEKNKDIKLVLSLGLLPKNKEWSLKYGAEGKYDDYFYDIAKKIASSNLKKPIVIRLGWEANGNWYEWAVTSTRQIDDWKSYWINVVKTFRKVDKDLFLFEWTLNFGPAKGGFDNELLYPGDPYVDIIGVDVYNFKNGRDPVRNWSYYLYSDYGLEWFLNLARKHKKPLAISEWGTGESEDGTGGGDDAYFVCQMINWINSNNILYDIYWDESASYNSRISKGAHPRSSSAFKNRVITPLQKSCDFYL